MVARALLGVGSMISEGLFLSPPDGNIKFNLFEK